MRRFACALLAVTIAASAVTGCKTPVDPMAQDLTADQYFQRAIEATDRDNYKLAMRYYEAFQARFPDDRVRNLWAVYEIGMLQHKLGDDDKAIAAFDKVLSLYQSDDPKSPLPAAPRVLAEKVKAGILKARKPPAPAAAAPAPAQPAAPRP
jgi:outer membrane protein assembly factor BamD (BamD/ComL family)